MACGVFPSLLRVPSVPEEACLLEEAEWVVSQPVMAGDVFQLWVGFAGHFASCYAPRLAPVVPGVLVLSGGLP